MSTVLRARVRACVCAVGVWQLHWQLSHAPFITIWAYIAKVRKCCVSECLTSDHLPFSDSDSDEEEEETPEFLPHEPLVLWEPNEAEIEEGKVPVQVPTVLAQFLRYVVAQVTNS